MKCKKCGKKLGKNEQFCTECGYYVGESDDTNWNTDANLLEEENAAFKDTKLNDKELEVEKISVKDSSGTKKTEYSYQHEDLLEAFIGEDYKLIKKMPFNIWSFLLNWMYFLYRKLYITGVIGLIVSWLVIVFLRQYFIHYLIITMIALGFVFNSYYIFIAKKKIEKIVSTSGDEDKFNLMSICMEKGGVSVLPALIIYFIFLIIVFFSLISFRFNKNHNPKFWQENSENRASCIMIIKTAYKNIEEENKVGLVSDAVCKVIRDNQKEYEIFIKTEKEEKNIYSYYKTENGYVAYKNNTLQLADLQVKRTNGIITPEENKLLTEIKSIEMNYQQIYNKSKEEERLIKEKKNTEERLNYFFTKEDIIQ